MKKPLKIAVLYTGGTIGMQAGHAGLKPSQETVLKALAAYEGEAEFEVTVCEPLIDSSQVTQAHWCQWQTWLLAQKNVDGILILHGTDSMAYTANVLALSCGSVTVPVVMTGSQMPLGTQDGDAEDNLEAAVQALLQHAVPQSVSVVFAQKLFAAIGCRKITTQNFEGFANKHQAPLAHFQQGVWHNLQDACDQKTKLGSVVLQEAHRIACHYCVPATDQWALRAILAAKPHAVIIQSFGHGNGLFSSKDVQAMQTFQAQGGVIVNVSQVFDGHVAAQYEASQALVLAGVVMGGTWTVETAYAQTWVALSRGLSGQALQECLKAQVI